MKFMKYIQINKKIYIHIPAKYHFEALKKI